MPKEKTTVACSGESSLDGRAFLKARERFVRRASHDLRQPLAALKLLFHELGQDIPQERRKELLRVMTGSVEMMQRFVGDLIAYEKLAAGLARIEPISFELTGLFSDLAENFSAHESAKDCELRFVPSSARIVADKQLLEQCLRYLIDNAMKYGEKGGRVLVGARSIGDTVRVEVWDRGPGIPPEGAESIFLPYFQLDAHRASVGALGLGLAIAGEIARQLNSQIELCSREGQGSRFSITLPRGTAPSHSGEMSTGSTTKDRPGTASHLQGLDVLLTGAPGPDRSKVAELLAGWGATVWDGDLTETLEALRGRKFEPTLAILCGPLPAEAELDRFTRSVERAFGAGNRCILVSPERPSEEGLGRAQYLESPIQPARLRSLITYLLHSSSTNQNGPAT